MPSRSKITFFTPSYRGDFDRLVLLRESIRRFYQGAARHLVAVPALEIPYFRDQIGDPDIEFISQESLVDPIFYPTSWYRSFQKIFPNQAWRLHRFGGRPGWFVQQVVKLNAACVVDTPVIVILDSDFVFMRQFGDESFLASDQTRGILYRTEPESESARQRNLMRHSRELLALAPGPDDHHYIAWPVVWNADWLKKLTIYVEKVHRRPWQTILFEAELFSEYCLYGVFAEEVLGVADIPVSTAVLHSIVWDDVSFDQFLAGALDESLTDYNNSRLGIVVQSNLHKASSDYRSKIYDLWDRISPGRPGGGEAQSAKPSSC